MVNFVKFNVFDNFLINIIKNDGQNFHLRQIILFIYLDHPNIDLKKNNGTVNSCF